MSGATEHGLFIDGKWVTPSGAKRFETHNPTNGEALGSFVAGTAKDVDAAITAVEKLCGPVGHQFSGSFVRP